METQENAAKNGAAAEEQAKRIDPGELAFLQDMQTRRSAAFADLGAVTHQIRTLEEKRDEMHANLGALDREYVAFSNRITKKYGLKPNTQIDLTSGEYQS